MNHGLIPNMKKLLAVPVIVALAMFCSCQKQQQTEEERNAQIEQQVQQRLTAERQADKEEQLARQKSELEARENALAEKGQAITNARVVEASETPLRSSRTDTSGNPPAASYSTFYTSLEPYGVWRETSNYGYVFQPHEAERSRSWRPYTNGRWVYTDVGWTWVSDEPFGWVAYHYGRWTRLRGIGWIWVPGEEWAPAWVSWRKSNDYVGWAPLPPEARFDRRTGIHNWADNYYDIGPDQFCFVPTHQFGARRVETVVVPAERNATIVNQTTNITNITYSNTTIVNEGPSYEELRTRTEQPIERLRLERRSTVNVGAGNQGPVIRGEVIEVAAPVIAMAQPAERPRNVKETVSQTIVEHGWEGISDRQAAEKARVKIKSESTPPPNAPPKTFVKPAEASAETSPISTPALTSPTALPARAPLARPTAPPRQIAPAISPKIPATTAAPPMPFRSAPPIATATAAPKLTPLPAVRLTPRPGEITTMPPHRTFSPRPHERSKASPSEPPMREPAETPSLSPTDSESDSSSPPSGNSIESKQQGKARRELRKEERNAQGRPNKGKLQDTKTHGADASSDGSATVTPTASRSPTESPQKEEKKKHKRDRVGLGEQQ